MKQALRLSEERVARFEHALRRAVAVRPQLDEAIVTVARERDQLHATFLQAIQAVQAEQERVLSKLQANVQDLIVRPTAAAVEPASSGTTPHATSVLALSSIQAAHAVELTA